MINIKKVKKAITVSLCLMILVVIGLLRVDGTKASLANSPWPTDIGNERRTGSTSQVINMTNPGIGTSTILSNKAYPNEFVVGNDGSIYYATSVKSTVNLVVGTKPTCAVVAIGADKSIKWTTDVSQTATTSDYCLARNNIILTQSGRLITIVRQYQYHIILGTGFWEPSYDILYVLDINTGSIITRKVLNFFDEGCQIEDMVMDSSDNIYFSAYGGYYFPMGYRMWWDDAFRRLGKMDLAGNKVWTVDQAGLMLQTIAIADGALYNYQSENNTGSLIVVKVRLTDGVQIWSKTFPSQSTANQDRFEGLLSSGDVVMSKVTTTNSSAPYYYTRYVYVLNKADGSMKYQYQIPHDYRDSYSIQRGYQFFGKVRISSSDNIYWSESPSERSGNYIFIKLSSTLQPQFNKGIYDIFGAGLSTVTGFMIDGQEDIYLGGNNISLPSSSYLTRMDKFGNLVWQASLQDSLGLSDAPEYLLNYAGMIRPSGKPGALLFWNRQLSSLNGQWVGAKYNNLIILGGIPLPTASLSATSTSLSYNSSTTLTWSSTDADSCVGTGFNTGNAKNGSVSTGNLTATKTYSITCTGAGGSDTKSITVNVSLPPAGSASAAATVYRSGNPTLGIVTTKTSSTATGDTWQSGAVGTPAIRVGDKLDMSNIIKDIAGNVIVSGTTYAWTWKNTAKTSPTTNTFNGNNSNLSSWTIPEAGNIVVTVTASSTVGGVTKVFTNTINIRVPKLQELVPE